MRKALTIAGATLSALQGVAHGADNVDQKVKVTALALHDSDYATTLTAPLNANARNMYASHSSHASHASHASHSSGSGASYSSPDYTPAYTPPDSTTSPSSPAVDTPLTPPPATSRPTTDQLQLMIMRVQAALYARGYDPGAIDGEMSEKTKEALRLFQAAHGLPPTAKMTTETLNALGVALTP